MTSTEQFVAALTEYQLDPTEIAEVLWLAMHQPRSEILEASESVIGDDDADSEEGATDAGVDDPEQDVIDPPEQTDDASAEDDAPFELTPEPPSGILPERTLPISVPDANFLDETLPLVRAMKPLLKQIESQLLSYVNEVATVERIAETDIWSPVMEPGQEPWFDVALVIDSSPAMSIWQRLIQDIQRLLRCYGSFRDFRVWQLVVTDGNPGVCTASSPEPVARSPKALLTPDARRLVLVFSDCTASYWWDGSLQPTLEIWGDATPTAIWQVLPDWMWKRTALGVGEYVTVRNHIPGANNSKLTPVFLSLRSAARRRRQPPEPVADSALVRPAPVCVPVITSNAESLEAWSRMLVGDRRASTPGFLLPATGWQPAPMSADKAQDDHLQEDVLDTFRLRSTPSARRLAALLSAAPVITLPVMRLIRASDELLPGSSPLPVAEVFLGGLLEKASEQPDDVEPERVQYVLAEGVRDRLLGILPKVDAIEVIEAVSGYVARQLNCTLADFRALLLSPDLKDEADRYGLRSFATMTAQILRKAGLEPEFPDLVRQLEGSPEPTDPDSDSDAGDTDWLAGFTHAKLTYQVAEYLNFPGLEPFPFEQCEFVEDSDILPAIPRTTLLITLEERISQEGLADLYVIDGWLVPDPDSYDANTGEGALKLSTWDINRYGDSTNEPDFYEGIAVSDIPNALDSFLAQVRPHTEETAFTIHLFLPQRLLSLSPEQMRVTSLLLEEVALGLGEDCHFVVVRLLERLNLGNWFHRWRSRWNQLQDYWQAPARDVFGQFVEGLSGNRSLGRVLHRSWQEREGFKTLLSQGTLLALWSRRETLEEEADWHRLIDDQILSGTVEEVPARVLAVRRSVEGGHPFFDFGTDLALLWDDPGLVPPAVQIDSVTFPPLSTEKFTLYTLERQLPAEELSRQPLLESFETTVATLISAGGRWQVKRQQQSAHRFIETLSSDGSGRGFVAQALSGFRRADSVALEMVAIPGGSFLMGSPANEVGRSNDESPQHEVTVESFFMGRYPVTQAQWKVVAAMPQVKRKLDPDPSRFKGAMLPVDRVSWYDAVEFCARLSAHTRREYRLPTESEWEYACRAGTTTAFHFGDMITPELANYNGSAYADGSAGNSRGQTTPVDQFGIANAYGLSDMHGNVYEWCQDRWHSNYKGAPTDGSAWLTDDEGAGRVRRGGSWIDLPRNCRSAYRVSSSPVSRNLSFGFRVSCATPRALT